MEPMVRSWDGSWDMLSEAGSAPDKQKEPEEEEGGFGALSLCNFQLNNVDTSGGRYVQMVFDSGASTTTFPPEIGEGYDLIKDQFVGRKYHGAWSEVIGDVGVPLTSSTKTGTPRP